MTITLKVNRRNILLGSCVISLLLAVTVLTMRTSSQQLRALNSNASSDVLARIEKSPDQPLRVLENDDSPLRIVDARVKEISGAEYTRLTGTTTNLAAVSSLPEATLLNSSGKTVTAFVLAVRDPISRSTRGFVQNKVAIAPGEIYVVKPEHFVDSEKLTVAEGNGQVRQTSAPIGMDSPKYWLQFASRPDMFITIGRVSFDDGSSWMVKEGGELK